MIRVWLFLVIFVGGPVVFHAGLIGARRVARHPNLVLVLALALSIAGLGMRFWLGDDWGVNALMTTLGLLGIWLGWIALLVYCALRMRKADPSRAMMRLTAVAGPFMTTVPWFGFAWAQMMAG